MTDRRPTMGDLHLRILARLDEIEAVARAADQRPWTVVKYGAAEVLSIGPDVGMILGPDSLVVAGPEDIRHIVLHQPAFVVGWAAGLRELVDDIHAERHYVNDGDCWYTCPVATEDRDGGTSCCSQNRGEPCDCGRDRRVARHLSMAAKALGLAADDE
jgi:hypothetical protein